MHYLKQAQLYVKQEKLVEASTLLEGKIMSMAGEMQSILMFMIEIALKEGKKDVAQYLAETSAHTAKLYDLWDYNAYMAHFQLAVLQEDVDQGIKYLELMLAAVKLGWNISNSMLYQHTRLKNKEESFVGHMINGLLASIQNHDSCVFLKTDSRFLEIVSAYNN